MTVRILIFSGNMGGCHFGGYNLKLFCGVLIEYREVLNELCMW